MARSAKKGPFVDAALVAKVERVRSGGKREVVKTWSRCSMVIPEFVGATIAVHDGRKFIPVFVTENMVGHKLGEFAPTRTFRMHSGQRKEEGAGAAPSAAPAASTAAPAAAAAPAASAEK